MTTPINAVNQYLEAQCAKGLINSIKHITTWAAGSSVLYETHWGAHQKVVLPEVQRLVAGRGLRLRAMVRTPGLNGSWIAGPTQLEATDYVRVILRIRRLRRA